MDVVLGNSSVCQILTIISRRVLKKAAWGGREKGFAGTLALFRFWRSLQHTGAGIQFPPPG
jgi:hypothetical protein